MIINPKKQNLEAVDNIKKITDCVSNPNLLDNWYFGNPVDQRGGYVVPPGKEYFDAATGYTKIGDTTTYYTVVRRNENGVNYIVISGTEYAVKPEDAVRGYAGYGYGIDRWKNNNGDITTSIGDGYVEIVNNTTWNEGISEPFEPELVKRLRGHKVTVSALFSDNTLSFGTIIYPNADGIADSVQLGGGAFFYVNPSANLHVLGTEPGKSIKPVAVKLELGTQQTLAHQDENGNWVLNEIPDYAEELAKCVQSIADGSDTYANKTILHTGNKDQIFTYGTSDLTAGTSSLESGKLYFVYE